MEQISYSMGQNLLPHLTNDPARFEKTESQANKKIHEVLFEQDDITWRSILQDLIKSNEIDPWDIDISQLTQKYIAMIKQFKEFDFKVSGKALLAAAVLLKIKSNRLVGEDLDEFDRIIAGEPDEDFFDENILATRDISEEEIKSLIPRLPQPRKRKVTIHDLMGALEKALEVKQRRVLKNTPEFNIEIPKKRPNVQLSIKNVYLQIRRFFVMGNKDLTFTKLIPSETKEDKVFTFIPLLHLSNRRSIDMHQNKPFGEIEIYLKSKKDIAKELAELDKPEEVEAS
tara:strand:+ start:1107 stop:1961 length:855 start_codon:yes stop_codon:yes gene_type:complete